MNANESKGVMSLDEILALLDNVTASTDTEADFLGQAENLLRNHRAAVAELVEAERNVERQPALDDATFMVNRPGVSIALIELRAALAHFNGEQA